MAIIKVENLCKDYRQRKGREGLTGAIKDVFNREYKIVKAVDSVSFSVEKGEIIGYIGPNGAGKSTTIKMLIGILVPTSGNIDVNGIVPFKHREVNAKRIGVVFGQRTQLWWDIPLSETLSLMRYVYDVPEKRYQENLKIFSDILGIDKFVHTPVRQLSLGQRMRADISVALLHNPDILYLDEPTIGLDVVVKERIREFILEMNKTRNTTVILATHDMSDIERLSSRVMVINSGKLVYDGHLDTLKRQYGSEEMIVAELLNKIEDTSELTGMGVDEIKYQDNKITIKYDSRELPCAKSTGRLNDFIIQTTLAV
ncbi:MAG: ATP-binding cassette domain-containing protein [Dehalococcoidales bacterium]